MEGGWLDERPGEPGGESEGEAPVRRKGRRSGWEGDGGRHRPPPRVLTMPVALRGARVAVSVRAVVAFVVVLVVAVVFFAVRVARAQEAAAPQPVPTGRGWSDGPRCRRRSPRPGSGGGCVVRRRRLPDASLTSGATARGSPGRLVVIDVVGQVVAPGRRHGPDGSRVVDVLTAAGGPLSGADVQRLNLARLVADGEQVFVPRPGETPPVLGRALWAVPVGLRAAAVPGAGGTSGGVGTAAASSTQHRHPGGPRHAPASVAVLAQRILDWRASTAGSPRSTSSARSAGSVKAARADPSRR